MRPKTTNRDLPPRMLRHKRTLKSGKVWESFYYAGRREDGTRVEIPLGHDLNDAKRWWAELECKTIPADTGLLRFIFDRYEKEIIPAKAPAGCEAAWQLARLGLRAVVHEMRPSKMTDAHQGGNLAELVCSNSLRSDDALYNAVGLLHEEMRCCSSLILEAADKTKVPAGGALAVDREKFSAFITERLRTHPGIIIKRGELCGLPPESWGQTIIATGPLTSPSLAEAIRLASGEEALSFFDAIAPIIYKESIDLSKAWFQSRYDKGTGTDYINCPMTREQYDTFLDALLAAEKTEFKDWEKNTPYFEGCLPVEVMAERGRQTLLYGPMKPVGLTNPHTPGQKPYAVVQLRQDNALGTLYNIVGFQTKLKYGEQGRIFRMIPGLEHAEFARLGGIHRNTFLNSPRLLDNRLRLKTMPRLRFAGQITGCEGYVESAAIGLIAGLFSAAEALGRNIDIPPATTALGSMLAHITGGAVADSYQPMNINFGLFPELTNDRDERGRRIKGRARKPLYAQRALADLDAWRDMMTLEVA